MKAHQAAQNDWASVLSKPSIKEDGSLSTPHSGAIELSADIGGNF